MDMIIGNKGSYWWLFQTSDCGYDDVPGSCAVGIDDESNYRRKYLHFCADVGAV